MVTFLQFLKSDPAPLALLALLAAGPVAEGLDTTTIVHPVNQIMMMDTTTMVAAELDIITMITMTIIIITIIRRRRRRSEASASGHGSSFSMYSVLTSRIKDEQENPCKEWSVPPVVQRTPNSITAGNYPPARIGQDPRHWRLSWSEWGPDEAVRWIDMPDCWLPTGRSFA